MSANDFKNLDTLAIHAGEDGVKYAGAVTAPIFQSATYLYGGESDYNEVKYTRLNNTPTHMMLNAKLAALEKAEDAIVTSSGMSAITTALLSIFERPGHLLTQSCLYGGTHYFLKNDFTRMGHSVTAVDVGDPSSWKAALRPETRAFYVESITNPLLEVADFEPILQFCRENGLISIIDNTIASPVNFNPIALGFDLAVHSCTKYLNGHSDIVAGCVVGSRKQVAPVVKKLNYLGGCLDAHACFLLNRGMKTLGLRVRQHNQNAQELARWLERQSFVKRVYYPGLESHVSHRNARKYLGGFGGMVSFEFKGDPREADGFMARLRLPKVAPSLGGVESLITRPTTTSHSGMSPAERKQIGISDELIRLSVGVEDLADLIADFTQAAT
ncbi:MAG TPA: aminotransferase class I/II-fold pyridoxal phosphate-dependent enzyme [Bdellovibrionales bacterium]|nr:aminotransferase class I/II-fold pyridoxal phosphate-dependent enzyme [Bdellovibrionales bacterium]